MKAKLLSITHNVVLLPKTTHRRAFDRGGRQEKRGSLVTLTHESSSQYFVSHYLLQILVHFK